MTIGYEYEFLNRARRGSDITANPKAEETEFSTVTLGGSYALSRRIRVQGLVPFKRIIAPKDDVASGDRFIRRFGGVGDALLALTYLPSAGEKNHTTVALSGGVRLPTGDANPDHDWGYGVSRDPVLQTGYGTVDPIWAVSVARAFGQTSATVSAAGRITSGTNVYGYKLGNETQLVGGASYGLNHWLDAGLSAAYLKSWHDIDHEVMVGNTGGEWLYALPSVTLKTAGVAFDASLQIPLYYFVNGGQLMSQSIFTTGMKFDLTAPAARLFSGDPAGGTSLPGTSMASVHKVIPSENISMEKLCSGDWALIEFMSASCNACRTLDPELHRFAARHPGLNIFQLDILEFPKASVEPLAIEATPTLVLLNPEGDTVLRVVGGNLKAIESKLTELR